VPLRRGKTTKEQRLKIKSELEENSSDTYSEKTDEFMRVDSETDSLNPPKEIQIDSLDKEDDYQNDFVNIARGEAIESHV
jgi:uncharacterized membrane protein YkoI